MFSSLGFIIMFITIIICTFIPYTFAAEEGGTPRRLQRGSSSRSQQISNERGTPRSVERRLREIMSQHQQMSGEPEYQPTDVGSPRTAGRRRREPRSQPQQMSGELELQPTGTPRSVERRLRETMLQHRQMSGEPEYQPTDVGSPWTPGRRRREPRSQRQQMSGELDLQPTVTPGWMGQGWSSQRQQISDDTEYHTQYQTPLQYTDQGTQGWMQQGWPSQQQQISDDTEYPTQYQTPLQYTDQGTLGWMEQGWSSQHQQIDDDLLLQYQSQLQLTDNAPVVSIRKMERGSSSRSQQFTSAPDDKDNVVRCINSVSRYFSKNGILEFPEVTVQDYEQDHAHLKKLYLAKNAIMYKTKNDRPDRDTIAWRYYESFENNLDSTNILGKYDFCSGNGQSSQSANRLNKKGRRDCIRQLNLFPESNDKALYYAFYETEYQDFSIQEYGQHYMVHMQGFVQVNDAVLDLLPFCLQELAKK